MPPSSPIQPPASAPLRLAGVRGVSDAGTVRRHNEDRFLVDAALGLVAVADGMGGHLAGAVASAEALASLHATLAKAPDVVAPRQIDPDSTAVDPRWRQAGALRHAVERANALLHQENCRRGHAEGQGMGTTLTGWQWLSQPGLIVSFHVGDSRLYRCRDGLLQQLTRDQTAYQLALETAGSGTLPPQNVLLQAVGPGASVIPDIALHAVQPGDLLLLCSDGLHGWVPHADLQAVLADAALPLDALCTALVALAKQHGSRDNITAVAARFAADR